MSEGASERERYEETLRRNRIWLRRLLASDRRVEDYLHLLVAARLRVLLHDGSDGPALIEYARMRDSLDDLQVWGPYGFEDSSVAFALDKVQWSPEDLRTSQRDSAHYRIDEYLEAYVGWWKVEGRDETRDGSLVVQLYTPRDLINWAANSEAVHHIPASDEKVERIQGVRGMEALAVRGPEGPEGEKWGEDKLAEAFFSLGEWTVAAIDHLLDGPEESLE